MRGSTGFSAAASLIAATATGLSGQQVTGLAHAAGSEVPVAAAAIVLVNDAGVIVAGTLTATDGHYILRAPAAGHYRVRARRIGFAPDSTELTLAGSATRFDPALTPLRASLEVVRIEGIQKCEVDHEAGDAAYQLWEAAQNALASTIAAAGDKLFVYRLERFVREIDPAVNRAVYGTTTRGRSRSSEPYYSVSPDSLATVGFARVEGDSSVYYAPDARTLTAEAFIRTHCLRAVRDSSRHDQLGLAFEPVRRSNVVDVSGVLWIDRASGELRDLDYHYELPRLARGRNLLPAGADAASGRIEYRRLDDGAWIVNRWVIQVPVEGELPGYTIGGRAAPPVRAKLVWQVGGAVLDVLQSDNPSTMVDEVAGAIDGRLLGGPDRLPVVGAPVSLKPRYGAAAGETQRTRGDGSFVFDSLAPGDYVLRLADLKFDTLDIAFAPIAVTVRAGNRQALTVAMPTPTEGREALCGNRDQRRLILHGTVTDSVTGLPLSGARVTATWMEIGNDTTTTEFHQRDASTDRAGQYVFCDLEPAARMVVSAGTGDRTNTSVAPFALRPDGTFMINLALSRRQWAEIDSSPRQGEAEYLVELKSSFDPTVYARLIADRVKGKIGSVHDQFHTFTIYGISDDAVALIVKMHEVLSVKKRGAGNLD
jgi:hypothetical protein